MERMASDPPESAPLGQLGTHTSWFFLRARPARQMPQQNVSTPGGGGLCLVRANRGDVHQMLSEEPGLELVGANHVADEQIIRAVVAGIRCLTGHGACLFEDDLVGFEKA
jgi:hypothetical protein